MKQYKFNIPAHLMPALINHDLSGLDSQEEELYLRIEKELLELCNDDEYCIINPDDDKFFCPFPDFGELACDCFSCIVLILKKK